MAYFPLFIDLKDKEIIVVGAGAVASRKIEKLLPFNPKITVVADKVSEYVKQLAGSKTIYLKNRKFEYEDLKNVFLVIVAVNDIELQKEIYQFCHKNGIFINSVDSPDYCSFIFPSLIVKDDIVIGITTSSKAPAVSKALRKFIEGKLPDNLRDLVEKINNIRKKDKSSINNLIKNFFKTNL